MRRWLLLVALVGCKSEPAKPDQAVWCDLMQWSVDDWKRTQDRYIAGTPDMCTTADCRAYAIALDCTILSEFGARVAGEIRGLTTAHSGTLGPAGASLGSTFAKFHDASDDLVSSTTYCAKSFAEAKQNPAQPHDVAVTYAVSLRRAPASFPKFAAVNAECRALTKR